jgi:hypothetical protein
MSDLLATLTVITLILVRVGVPLLALAMLSFALQRLDARWQQEALVHNNL